MNFRAIGQVLSCDIMCFGLEVDVSAPSFMSLCSDNVRQRQIRAALYFLAFRKTDGMFLRYLFDKSLGILYHRRTLVLEG